MQFTTALLSLLPLLAQSSPVELERRACSVAQPSFVGTIDSLDPNYNAAPGPGGSGTTLAFKDPNIVRSNVTGKGLTMDTLLEFSNIPAGAYGCQLELFFARDYWTLYDYPPGPRSIDIWNTDGPVPKSPTSGNYSLTWNTAPKKTSLFGTIGNIELPPFSQDIKKVVNSAACKSKLTWRIAVPPQVVQGGLQFFQNQSPVGGWRLTYNC
jgi:hypothetical protein